MLDIFFAMLAAGMNAAPAPQAQALVAPSVVTPQVQVAPEDNSTASVQINPNSVTIGQGTVIAGTPVAPTAAAAGFNMGVVPGGLVAEPQVPSGKFTTAAEVKPILNATKGNWVAVRDYGGQDLLYVTHLWGWRCGLKAMAISINDEPMQNWPLPPCRENTATPASIIESDGPPYLTLRQGAVQTITIQIVYDDLSMDMARFERNAVLIP